MTPASVPSAVVPWLVAVGAIVVVALAAAVSSRGASTDVPTATGRSRSGAVWLAIIVLGFAAGFWLGWQAPPLWGALGGLPLVLVVGA